MIEGLIARLGALDPAERRRVISRLTPQHRAALAQHIQTIRDNPWLKYQHDPVGFVRDGIGETIWTKQAEILESIRDHKRTSIPASHSPGKSHVAARAVAWWVSAHPPGTAQVVTTATTFRQVRNIMWPHIRRLQTRHGLPGSTNQVEWHMGPELVAYGFSAESSNEAALQGVHAVNLLIVVDEAGGISHTLGQAMEALMTGGHTRLVVIGNPPTDEEGTWFERTTTSPLYHVIHISAFDTPNFTGEDPGICRTCPPVTATHSIGQHLVDESWVNDIKSEYGEDSPLYIARVLAQFPRSSANKVIPFSWLEKAAQPRTGPAVTVRLPDGTEVKEPGPEIPHVPGKIRMGIDVASDGGDELAIAVMDGTHGKVTKTSQGADLEDAVVVAGICWEQIQWAAKVHEERAIAEPVRVKVDALGVGWGVVGLLGAWVSERGLGGKVTIVPVKVSQNARDEVKFGRQRAEMWWYGREMVMAKPREDGTVGPTITIENDRKLLAQLSGPKYKHDSGGRIEIEKKIDMKKRGVPSPDRAEALLLALYEPPGFVGTVAPVSITKENHFVLR